MTLDNEIVGVDGGAFENVEPAYTGSFEPSMPVSLSRFGLERFAWAEDFNVITRVIVPFIFPSASDDALGQGKWQAGPAGVAGYLTNDWNAYVVAQQWWSFAGDGDRPSTSQLELNYVLLRNLPGSWQVGMQPSLTVDWKAPGGNKVSFPVGLGVGKTVRIGKLPVQFYVEADYFAVRPDDVPGPRWSIDIQIIPVIPELF
jgi:hypothetical protein